MKEKVVMPISMSAVQCAQMLFYVVMTVYFFTTKASCRLVIVTTKIRGTRTQPVNLIRHLTETSVYIFSSLTLLIYMVNNPATFIKINSNCVGK